MSAIVAAAQRLEDRRIDAVLGRAFTRGDELRAMIIAAGRAIVAASNAAGAGRVVEGAPRTWAVQWVEVLAGWMIAHDDGPWAATYSEPPTPFLEPCWDAANRLWVWSTAAHDPRPCAWPRPFARGA